MHSSCCAGCHIYIHIDVETTSAMRHMLFASLYPHFDSDDILPLQRTRKHYKHYKHSPLSIGEPTSRHTTPRRGLQRCCLHCWHDDFHACNVQKVDLGYPLQHFEFVLLGCIQAQEAECRVNESEVQNAPEQGTRSITFLTKQELRAVALAELPSAELALVKPATPPAALPALQPPSRVSCCPSMAVYTAPCVVYYFGSCCSSQVHCQVPDDANAGLHGPVCGPFKPCLPASWSWQKGCTQRPELMHGKACTACLQTPLKLVMCETHMATPPAGLPACRQSDAGHAKGCNFSANKQVSHRDIAM